MKQWVSKKHFSAEITLKMRVMNIKYQSFQNDFRTVSKVQLKTKP